MISAILVRFAMGPGLNDLRFQVTGESLEVGRGLEAEVGPDGQELIALFAPIEGSYLVIDGAAPEVGACEFLEVVWVLPKTDPVPRSLPLVPVARPLARWGHPVAAEPNPRLPPHSPGVTQVQFAAFAFQQILTDSHQISVRRKAQLTLSNFI